MATAMPPITDYYRVVFAVNGTGGPFNLALLIRREDAYNGDGTEFGPGTIAGDRQIYRVAKQIAKGLENADPAGVWANITVTSIDGNIHSRNAISSPAVP